ncbi:copper resistance CopC family protein [Angustibacter aerolatus]|uniref:CopC domain-containing protein n=1 Tax=Angustibacter aerolatus TaxID=1162965 RepID=A0ABQ6JGC9_9ACTN|nr:copper resistance CopC family protein [Angustibacter aerolatus]GMA85836.1 hypothetical protein GCM10025868_10860 [Angustibacter aerolatus]
MTGRGGLRRLTLAAIGALAAVLVAAGPAAAHDELESTNPADGATVAAVPDAIVLTFGEPALAVGTRLVVTGPSGQVQQGAPRVVDEEVRQPLAAGAPAGRYDVQWRVTSADGHPVSGEFRFTAKGAAASTTPSSPAAATASTTATAGTATAASTATTATGSAAEDPAEQTSSTGRVLLVGLGVLVLLGAVVLVARRRRPGAH